MSGLRRYAPMKPSRGTTWPPDVKAEILRLDGYRCVAFRAGLPDSTCDTFLEVDHVRASHGIGMKSRSTVDNGVTLCGRHHRYKTSNGRAARPLLLDWIAKRSGDCTHVEPVHGCGSCRRHADPLTLPETA